SASVHRRHLASRMYNGRIDGKSLFSDEWVREVYGIGNRIDIGWIHRDELIALTQFEFAPNAKVCPRAPLLANTCFVNGINERSGTAIQNWQLQIIQFEDRKSTRLNSSHEWTSYAV